MSEKKLVVIDKSVERIDRVEKPSRVVVEDKCVHHVKPVEVEIGSTAVGIVEMKVILA